ncbi:MAG: hypothetical protein IAE79_05900 [Anaerolinea sp.]|nr:hypothetical protein [Anaerolinea sp.]
MKQVNARLHALPYLLLLLIGVAWFYAPTLHFGFIWDDPQWFGRVIGKSWLELVQATPDFQFYRPGTMLYNRLFLRRDGVFAVLALHAAQIGWHLLNTALFYAISRRLGLTRWRAWAAAALFATYPFAYQAVSWAAPQQPLAIGLQQGAWLAYLHARQEGQGTRRFWPWLTLSIFLFIVALSVQESGIPLAFTPLLFEWLQQRGCTLRTSAANILRSNGRFALFYPVLAAAYALWWLHVPRQSGITGLYGDPEAALYLLQGFIYPLIGRPHGYPPAHPLAANTVWLIGVLTLSVLAAAATWQRQGRLALVGGVWAVLGLSPALIGLPFSYVSLSPRLLYYAAPGIAWLWIAAISGQNGRRTPGIQWIGMLLVAAILMHNSQMLSALNRLHQPGIAHMQEMLTAMTGQNGRFLFINFPDRYQPQRPPYPIGYWGVTLAPVVVSLGEFPAMVTTSKPDILSYSLPWVDADARANGPYQVDMRGVILGAAELYTAAAGQEGVYVSHYLPDGRFTLQLAGSRMVGAAPACSLVLFDQTICLHDVHVAPTDTAWRVRLTWSVVTTVTPHLTIFTHLGAVGQPPLAQADGDAWRALLPPVLWQPGDLITDWRELPRLPHDDDLSIQIGVYNWVSEEQLAGVLVEGGRPLPGDAFTYPLPP